MADARDVADGMIRAAETGKTGDRYVLAGRLAPVESIFQTLEAVSGVAAPRFKVPYPVVLAMAWVSQNIARILGRDTLMTVSGVRTMRDGLRSRISSAKAEKELGVTFRSLTDTLRDEVDWYRSREQGA